MVCKPLYKPTSSIYGERTSTSSHHVYVVYTLLTVHIKCIWSTNFDKFTSSVYGVWNSYRLTSSVYGEQTPTSPHQVYMVYEILQVDIKCVWWTNAYKSTSSVYGERTPTSSHHVYVVYTLLTVHIKCIWSTNFYKFTSSVYGVWNFTSSHQVCMVYELLQVDIKCVWWTNAYKFTIMCMWCTHF